VKILTPFSLGCVFGCHFGCHQKRADAGLLHLPLESWDGGLGKYERSDCRLQTGIDPRDTLCSISAPVFAVGCCASRIGAAWVEQVRHRFSALA